MVNGKEREKRPNRAKSGEILDLPFSYSAQFIPSSLDGSFLSIGHKTITLKQISGKS